MNLYQISTPENAPKAFVAGLCVDAKGVVWKAAPIIRWLEEKPMGFVAGYCKKKGWKLDSVQ